MNRIFTSVKRNYEKYITPTVSTPKDGLLYWREKVLLQVTYVLFYSGIIAYIPSMILSLKENLWSLAIIDTFVYATIFCIFFNRDIRSRLKIFILLTYCYMLGVVLILLVGPYGAGYLWLFVIPIVAGIFLESKSVFYLLILNIVTLILLGAVQYWFPLQPENIIFPVSSWLVISANFILLNIIVTFSTTLLFRGLKQTLENEKVMIDSLEKQNQQTIIAKEEAEKASKIKSLFLAQVSHEVRTPVNVILNLSSILKEDITGFINDDFKELFSSIEIAGMRLVRTVDLILNMSELQTGTYETLFSEIDIKEEIIDNLLQEFKVNSELKNLKLISDLPNNLPKVKGDDYSIMQIFANLIDNAIKYTNQGEVRILAERHENKLKVKVQDTGIGMTGEFMNKMFDVFTQEEEGYSRKFEGNGLGLALVKKYCEINNLEIHVDSKKGYGTTFSIIFNVSD